jgi:hypothetical protein
MNQLDLELDRASQSDLILAALERGHAITPLFALGAWGCFRLAARIADLRRLGYDIETKNVRGGNGKHFAEYRLRREGVMNYEVGR